MKKVQLVVIFLACMQIAACAPSPIVSGESITQQKTISLPKAGQQSSVNTGGLVLMNTDYQSRFTYRLKQPFLMPAMLINKIQVSIDEPLTESIIDNATGYCSRSMLYYDVIAGPRSIVCFRSVEKGKFSSVTYNPGAIILSKDISPPVEYEIREYGFSQGARPMKREIFFDGGENNVLMFTERLFDVSLETPSRIKPLIARIDALPAKITLDGAEISVINYSRNSLTYVVTAP
jgi:hypothetical protein